MHGIVRGGVWMCSVVSDTLGPQELACQAPLSMGFFQARILEWVAISYSRGSSWLRDRTCISCTGRRFFTTAKPTWRDRPFQSPERWGEAKLEGGSAPGLLCRQTFMGRLWEHFHRTSALQPSDCCCWGRESCWSCVNLKMGSVGSCQMDICDSLSHSRQDRGMQERKWRKKLNVLST